MCIKKIKQRAKQELSRSVEELIKEYPIEKFLEDPTTAEEIKIPKNLEELEFRRLALAEFKYARDLSKILIKNAKTPLTIDEDFSIRLFVRGTLPSLPEWFSLLEQVKREQ